MVESDGSIRHDIQAATPNPTSTNAMPPPRGVGLACDDLIPTESIHPMRGNTVIRIRVNANEARMVAKTSSDISDAM
jgi:hypothetical protein